MVTKDDIRKALETQGWKWSRENEKDVEFCRDVQMKSALGKGLSVISADTNFAPKHRVRLEALAKEFGAEFEVKDFPTPIEECIQRDSRRPEGERVGEKVIRDMAQRYHVGEVVPQVVKVEPDEHLASAIICDLDGTLALFKEKGHRGPYDATRCDEDDCNMVVRRLLEIYYRFMQYQIIYLSGREDCYREPTMTFMRKFHCPPGPLYMRNTGDFRKDCVVKGELFDEHVRGKYNVEFVLDDRDQVVNYWRSLGLQCFQVADGKF